MPRGIVYEEIDEYIDGLANRGDPALRAVERQGEAEGWAIVAAAEGSFLHILARSIRARRILELGTAIGYSGTWLARALHDDGELVTVEHNPETAAIARKNMEKTGVAPKVRILVGDAQEILKDLKGPFDFIFFRHRQGWISRGLGPRDRAPPSWWTPRHGQRLVGRRCGPQRPIEGDAGHPDLQRTAVEGPADDRRDRSPSGWRLRRAEGSRVGRPVRGLRALPVSGILAEGPPVSILYNPWAWMPLHGSEVKPRPHLRRDGRPSLPRSRSWHAPVPPRRRDAPISDRAQWRDGLRR